MGGLINRQFKWYCPGRISVSFAFSSANIDQSFRESTSLVVLVQCHTCWYNSWNTRLPPHCVVPCPFVERWNGIKNSLGSRCKPAPLLTQPLCPLRLLAQSLAGDYPIVSVDFDAENFTQPLGLLPSAADSRMLSGGAA